MPVAARPTSDDQLADEVARYFADPLGFVLFAYPWGEPGALEGHDGPDIWQREFLRGVGAEVAAAAFDGLTPVAPIRRAVASGHGVGKSTMAAWLVDWIMSTRPLARGTVTANTFTQLQTKTWSAIKEWTSRCITAHWWVLGDQRMYHKDHKDSWFCAPQSCKEENTEAFAGQHAATSTSFYIFDEDSAISDKIHEVAEGGLTDGQPMIFRFGNPTRSMGGFHAAVFGHDRARWHPTIIDSRQSRLTNKAQIAEWEQEFGEDSDFFRVRVRGIPPRASDAQFIDHERVLQAQKRQVAVMPDEPLVVGCDLAWGGCFDCETEILTSDGWKLFSDLRGSEAVLSLDGDVATWARMTAIHRYWHDGAMNLRESSKVNFCVTDNHNFIVRSHYMSKRYQIRRYDRLPKAYQLRAWHRWEGTSPATIAFESQKRQPHGGAVVWRHTFAAEDWAAFLGWFVAEGNVYTAKLRPGQQQRPLVVELSQRHAEKRKEIERLLSRMGLRHSRWSSHGTIRFQHRGIGAWLLEHCGHGAANKRMPEWIKEGSAIVMRAFLDAFRRGDGSQHPDGTGRCYYTSSRALADDLQEVLAKLGCAGKLSPAAPAGSVVLIEGRRVVRQHDTWRVGERPSHGRQGNRWHADRTVLKRTTQRVPYRGFVWCVSTPHRTIYVRRHGVPMWSGNSDDNVIRFRRGNDARSISPIRIKGEFTRDPAVLVNRLADVLSRTWDEHPVAALFLDSAGIAGPIGARLRALGFQQVREINFGSDSPDSKCRYYRDYMWQQMKEWLLQGAIDTSAELESDLIGPGVRPDPRQRVWLESKEQMKGRGVDSPDEGDALSLTFAAPVGVVQRPTSRVKRPGSWMGV